MSTFETEKELLNSKENINILGGFIITVYGKENLSVEGHKGINKFSDEYIALKLKKNLLEITGKNLTLKHFSEGNAIINGKIENIAITENDNNK